MLINAILALGLATACQAHAITVFACEPEWASLTRTLLPEATVQTATTHLQDPHHIEARPSLIAQLRRADFAICTGAELEAGWLPMLQDRAGNPKVQSGTGSMFFCRRACGFDRSLPGNHHTIFGRCSCVRQSPCPRGSASGLASSQGLGVETWDRFPREEVSGRPKPDPVRIRNGCKDRCLGTAGAGTQGASGYYPTRIVWLPLALVGYEVHCRS